MTTVFVYEYLMAIGADGDSSSPPAPSLYCEGRAMFEAISADLQSLPDVEVRHLQRDNRDDFTRLARECDWSLIIAPEFDGILEDRCRNVLAAGGRLLGPTPDAVRLTADKWKLFQHFREQQIPTPDTWRHRERQMSFPFVVKPFDGAGSQRTFLINDEGDYRRTIEEVGSEQLSKSIFQRYVEGDAASVGVIGGCIALQPCSQRISNEGRFHYLGGSTPIRTDLRERAQALALRAVQSVPGLNGYVGVDLVLGNEDVAIEINPRLTTSYIGLRQAANFNIAGMMLNLADGKPPGEAGWKATTVTFDPSGHTIPV